MNSPSADSTESRYSFGEAVADLATNFAFAEWLPQDSRELPRLCIEWAEIFEARNTGRQWDGEYLEAIDAFFVEQYAFWQASREPSRENPLVRRAKLSP